MAVSAPRRGIRQAPALRDAGASAALVSPIRAGAAARVAGIPPH